LHLKKISPVNRDPPLRIAALLLVIPAGGVGCPPTENARQFSVSCVLTGSAASPEIAVAPIKSAFLSLRSYLGQ
jgi:hypothetical protein